MTMVLLWKVVFVMEVGIGDVVTLLNHQLWMKMNDETWTLFTENKKRTIINFICYGWKLNNIK
jgi:hypothetical protein